MRSFFAISLASTFLFAAFSSPAFGDDTIPPADTLSLYSRDFELPEDAPASLVIEVAQRQAPEILIAAPVDMAFQTGWSNDAELERYDPFPAPVATTGYRLVLTSYMQTTASELWVQGVATAAADLRVPQDTSVLVKPTTRAKLIGRGENRLRATLFKDGQPIAASNIITIRGLPATRPVSPLQEALQRKRAAELRNARPASRPAR